MIVRDVIDEFRGIGKSQCMHINKLYHIGLVIALIYTGDTFARCTLCLPDFSVSHGGRMMLLPMLMASDTRKQHLLPLRLAQ